MNSIIKGSLLPSIPNGRKQPNRYVEPVAPYTPNLGAIFVGVPGTADYLPYGAPIDPDQWNGINDITMVQVILDFNTVTVNPNYRDGTLVLPL